MNIHDLQIHPAFLDPRRWVEIKLYESMNYADREPIKGAEHHTPDRKFALKHLKLDLNFDDEREAISGSATLTIIPLSDSFNHFELDIAEMAISSVKLQRVERSGTAASAEAAVPS